MTPEITNRYSQVQEDLIQSRIQQQKQQNKLLEVQKVNRKLNRMSAHDVKMIQEDRTEYDQFLKSPEDFITDRQKRLTLEVENVD